MGAWEKTGDFPDFPWQSISSLGHRDACFFPARFLKVSTDSSEGEKKSNKLQ